MSHHHEKEAPPPRHGLAVRRLILPALVYALAYGFTMWVDRHAQDANHRVLELAAGTLQWLSYAFVLIRLVDVLVWRYAMVLRGRHVPRLLRDLFALFVLFIAACIILSMVFEQSLTALLTASTVGLGVVGFALKEPIHNAFSGIAITVQKHFEVNDWLEIPGTNEIGRVVEINWADLHLVTADEITYIVPTSMFHSQRTKVYTRPEKFFRDELRITLPYHVTTHQGQRILLGAVNQVEEISAIPRRAIVSIADYTDSGILWRLLYWCPDPGRLPTFRYLIHQNILRNLHYANIEIPFPVRELRRDSSQPRSAREVGDIDPLIQRVSIFATLTAEELRHLSLSAHNRLAHAGVPLLRQGECGDSLFILREGMLEVRKTLADNSETVVDHIRPGQAFGEMSLLLGEPRSATIVPVGDALVFEITKEAMQPLMQARPDLVRYLAELLAQRQSHSAAKVAAHHASMQQHSLFDQLADRIRQFFSIS